MMKHLVQSVAVTLLAAAVPVASLAQDERPPADAAARQGDIVPLDIQVVVTRYQGDKKVTSVPFSLAVNANDPVPSQLRMGASVPVPSLVAPKDGPGTPAGPLPGPVNYRDIGTNIDCNAKTLEDGRFQVYLLVEDSSVYTDVLEGTAPAAKEMPVFRSFKSRNTLVLKEGQTRQFTAATDRVSGEVIKIEVTLRVVK